MVDDIEQVTSAKLLGIILHERWCFDEPVRYVLGICAQCMYLLKRVTKVLPFTS